MDFRFSHAKYASQHVVKNDPPKFFIVRTIKVRLSFVFTRTSFLFSGDRQMIFTLSMTHFEIFKYIQCEFINLNDLYLWAVLRWLVSAKPGSISLISVAFFYFIKVPLVGFLLRLAIYNYIYGSGIAAVRKRNE